MQLLTDTSRKRPLHVTENKVHNLLIRKWIRNPTSENEPIPKIIESQFSCKIMHAFLTKLVQLGWLNIAQGLLGVFMDRDEAEVNKNARKKTRTTFSHLDQTSLVSQRNYHIVQLNENFFLRDQRGKSRAGKMRPSCPFG